MTLLDVLVLFVCGALLVISTIAVLNALTFSRLRSVDFTGNAARLPRISMLIPARNEAAVIGDTMRALLAQDYPDFEVLLLDDHSEDGTGEVARASAQADARLRIYSGEALPSGWMGKNWACHQLAQQATGDLWVFTDADVCWQPGALRALVARQMVTDADLLTVWPTQITVTWGERLVVPLMALVVNSYLPLLAVHRVPLSAFAAACGQCMAWQREAYLAVGGHAAVRETVLEDVTMARVLKRTRIAGRRGRLHMADGNWLVQTRMYRRWADVLNGYAKNILAGYGGSVVFLGLGAAFHWLVFLLPLLLLFVPGYAPWGVALLVLGITVRALTAAMTHQRVQDALLMPVSVLLMTRIAAQSVYWQRRYGGPQWKGRTVPSKVQKEI